ncbi:hypothetical protein AFLA70_152g002441 [Aspergillus flavus AF70]|nr:hypothetical protein AFLA70_152g002441 [Aspergillus flavus AF70]
MCTSTKRYYPLSPRLVALSPRTRDKAFQDQIRRRDGRCVITGQINLEACVDRWIQWDTDRIFPLALDSIFQSQGYSKPVTYNTPPGITSPQNGILLRKDIHARWDDHSIAVNSNDGYRIQSFTPGTWEYHGKILDSVCRQPRQSIECC